MNKQSISVSMTELEGYLKPSVVTFLADMEEVGAASTFKVVTSTLEQGTRTIRGMSFR